MNFSERFGFEAIRNTIQTNSMSKTLGVSLWNVYSSMILEIESQYGIVFYTSASSMYSLILSLWTNFYKEPIESIPSRYDDVKGVISSRFLNDFKWNRKYDFLEFIANDPYMNRVGYAVTFCENCNIILEREMSAYRFVDRKLIGITKEEEIISLESALKGTESDKLKGAHIHLQTAIRKLADREHPDYRNSIKESISAVESICQIISKDDKAELGKALKVLKTEIEIHPALEQGFTKIYGYTSGAAGIRHAMLEESTLGYEDAMYMLVACSAFVNYLIIKAQKFGIAFD